MESWQKMFPPNRYRQSASNFYRRFRGSPCRLWTENPGFCKASGQTPEAEPPRFYRSLPGWQSVSSEAWRGHNSQQVKPCRSRCAMELCLPQQSGYRGNQAHTPSF
jgi:hypothetical protein